MGVKMTLFMCQFKQLSSYLCLQGEMWRDHIMLTSGIIRKIYLCHLACRYKCTRNHSLSINLNGGPIFFPDTTYHNSNKYIQGQVSYLWIGSNQGKRAIRAFAISNNANGVLTKYYCTAEILVSPGIRLGSASEYCLLQKYADIYIPEVLYRFAIALYEYTQNE